MKAVGFCALLALIAGTVLVPATAGTVTPNPASPGQTITISGPVTVSQDAPSSAVFYWLASSPTANAIAQTSASPVNFAANQPTTVSASMVLPSNLAAGTYYLAVGVYNSSGQAVLFTTSYASFTVQTTVTPSVSPNPASPGQTITISGPVTVSQDAPSSAVFYWLASSPTANAIAQTSASPVNFAANQPTTVSASMVLPSNLAAGTYYLAVGVYNSSGQAVLFTTSYASFTVQTTVTPSVSPNPASPGQTITISGPVTVSQDAPSSAVFYWLASSPTANAIAQTSASPVNFAANQPTTVSASMVLPSNLAAGTYYLAVGVYNSSGQAVLFTTSYASFSVQGASAGAIKWHPGHYVSSVTLPTTPSSLTGQDLSAINDMGSAGNATGHFQGFQEDVTWYYLENAAGGTYRWDIIDDELAQLATRSATDGVTYRLIISMETEGFSPVPSVPQAIAYLSGDGSSSNSIAPDYLINGLTAGAGTGVLNSTDFGSPGFAVIALWRQNEMNAYINLMDAMCDRYDGNPNVEAIIPISETGMSIGSIASSDTTYSGGSLIAQYEQLANSMAQHCKHTLVYLMNNWNVIPTSQSSLTALTQNWVANGLGFGFGGPDILYNTGGWPTFGVQIETGAGGQFGTTDYRGVVPLHYMDRADWEAWACCQLSSGAENYEYNTLQATHVDWADVPAGFASPPINAPAGTLFSATVSVLQSNSWRVHGACPSNISSTAGCNTN